MQLYMSTLSQQGKDHHVTEERTGGDSPDSCLNPSWPGSMLACSMLLASLNLSFLNLWNAGQPSPYKNAAKITNQSTWWWVYTRSQFLLFRFFIHFVCLILYSQLHCRAAPMASGFSWIMKHARGSCELGLLKRGWKRGEMVLAGCGSFLYRQKQWV